MKKDRKTARKLPERSTVEIRPEYDFSTGVRGKYARRYSEGTNVVVLEPDLAAEFPTAREVNNALRGVLEERAARRKR